MPDELSITMLPAKEGDCLVVSYGDDANRKYILIDGGRAWTYRNALKKYLAESSIRELELVVITHVDRDHIDGILALVEDPEFDLPVKNVWFNTYDHLNNVAIVTVDEDDDEEFGGRMGEDLSTLLIGKGWPWNKHFDGFAVELNDEPSRNNIQLGDVRLTLLSPDREKLEKLEPTWEKECKKAGLKAGYGVEEYVVEDDDDESFGGGNLNIDQLAVEGFTEDTSNANGSSIAFILEYKGKKLLLSGDAHSGLLEQELKRLGASAANPLQIDLFKVPHHGSKNNISKPLLELLNCDNYLVSTNGNYFKHPNEVGMARLIKFGSENSTICFNYKTDFNKFWGKNSWKSKYKFDVSYPDDGEEGFKTLTFVVD